MHELQIICAILRLVLLGLSDEAQKQAQHPPLLNDSVPAIVAQSSR
jgi:hypothetical protein